MNFSGANFEWFCISNKIRRVFCFTVILSGADPRWLTHSLLLEFLQGCPSTRYWPRSPISKVLNKNKFTRRRSGEYGHSWTRIRWWSWHRGPKILMKNYTLQKSSLLWHMGHLTHLFSRAYLFGIFTSKFAMHLSQCSFHFWKAWQSCLSATRSQSFWMLFLSMWSPVGKVLAMGNRKEAARVSSGGYGGWGSMQIMDRAHFGVLFFWKKS